MASSSATEEVRSNTPSRERTSRPFTPRKLIRLDEALTFASRESGITFSVYVGELGEPTRGHAERLHSELPEPNDSVLIVVSPGQRIVEIVTGAESGRRLSDRACALTVLSMNSAFSGGDLIGGLVNGLRMMSDQAGRLNQPSYR